MRQVGDVAGGAERLGDILRRLNAAHGEQTVTGLVERAVRRVGELFDRVAEDEVALHPQHARCPGRADAAVDVHFQNHLVVVLKPGESFGRHEMVEHYTGRISKWSIPDDVIIVDELPHTATGKLLKTAIRDIVLKEYASVTPDDSIIG